MRPETSRQGPPVDAHTEPLRETLRLACDLADALATQSDRAKRQADELAPSPLAPTEIDRLVNQASRVRRQCAEMLAELDTIEPAPASNAESEIEGLADGPAGPRIGARGRAIDSAIQTVVLDLKMSGRSREEIEQTLIETFDVEHAADIVDGIVERVPA
jgi:hypothetical protein